MNNDLARNVFGGAAFVMAGAVIGLALSPWVPDAKEGIANVVLGNVLGWPAIVLAFHFGTTKSSATKDATISAMASTPADPRPMPMFDSVNDPRPIPTLDQPGPPPPPPSK